jgi:chemotaxis signal transduction protein
MPIIELGQVIGLGGSVLNSGPRINVVVCNFGGQAVGLAVDEILDIVHSDSVRPTGRERTVIVDGLVTDVVSPASLISVALPSLRRVVEPVAEGDAEAGAGAGAGPGAGAEADLETATVGVEP